MQFPAFFSSLIWKKTVNGKRPNYISLCVLSIAILALILFTEIEIGWLTGKEEEIECDVNLYGRKAISVAGVVFLSILGLFCIYCIYKHSKLGSGGALGIV